MPILQSLYLASYTQKKVRSAVGDRANTQTHSTAKLEENLINLRNKKWKTGKKIAIIKNQRRHRSKTNTLSIKVPIPTQSAYNSTKQGERKVRERKGGDQ